MRSPKAKLSVYGRMGVTLWTDDIPRLLRFYSDTLGLTPHSVHQEFVAFKFGEVRLNLGRHSQMRGQATDPYRIMVNLGAREIHQLTQELLSKGVEFIRLPEREHWGGYVATFRDPRRQHCSAPATAPVMRETFCPEGFPALHW